MPRQSNRAAPATGAQPKTSDRGISDDPQTSASFRSTPANPPGSRRSRPPASAANSSSEDNGLPRQNYCRLAPKDREIGGARALPPCGGKLIPEGWQYKSQMEKKAYTCENCEKTKTGEYRKCSNCNFSVCEECLKKAHEDGLRKGSEFVHFPR